MAGHKIQFQDGTIGFIDYCDATGECILNGKKYQWEFHNYLGPTFLKQNGDPLIRQPGENHSVWKEFEKWYKLYRKNNENK